MTALLEGPKTERTTVLLTVSLREAAQRMARDLSISLGELTRQALSATVETNSKPEDAMNPPRVILGSTERPVGPARSAYDTEDEYVDGEILIRYYQNRSTYTDIALSTGIPLSRISSVVCATTREAFEASQEPSDSEPRCDGCVSWGGQGRDLPYRNTTEEVCRNRRSDLHGTVTVAADGCPSFRGA